jgi:signal transduction histidine kinase
MDCDDLPAALRAIELEQIGVATLDARLCVASRFGALSNWLPEPGRRACDSPLLLNMDASLHALKSAATGELLLPSMRAPNDGARKLTISIVWDPEGRRYLVTTAPDHGGDQIDRLLVAERREKLLLQQQAEAATARLRVSDALYRDLVESGGDYVLRFGADQRVLFANRRVSELLGLAPGAMIGQGVEALFPPADGETPWRLQNYLERPASFLLAARDAADGPVWLWWDVRRSGDEATGEFQAIGRDVSATRRLRAERIKAREEARAAELAAQRLAIAHDLHDTLARSMVSLVLEMGLVAKTTSDPKTAATLREMQAHARAGLAGARAAIAELRVGRGDDDDPGRILANFSQNVANRLDLEVAAEVTLEPRDVPGPLAQTVSRILREALRNVELHSGARHVDVRLSKVGGMLRLAIADDGVGFDPTRTPEGHYGLLGMEERAVELAGKLEIASKPGVGTRVVFTAPLALVRQESS